MILKIPSRGVFGVSSLQEASTVYSKERDESCEGASTFAEGTVVDDVGVKIARISYNGRVWAPGPWTSGAEPLI